MRVGLDRSTETSCTKGPAGTEAHGPQLPQAAPLGGRQPTCEKGSSSELGKSYWLRSLALKTTGPGWWGVPDERGNAFCFFSYFLFWRGTSVFSGWKKTGEDE